jgi:hypothetical protein
MGLEVSIYSEVRPYEAVIRDKLWLPTVRKHFDTE